MKVLLLLLPSLFLLLIALLLLPLFVEVELIGTTIRIRVDKIFRKKLSLNKILTKINEKNQIKTKPQDSALIKEIVKTLWVKELRIDYTIGDDFERLALIEGLVSSLVPLLRLLVNDNLGCFYYKGRVGEKTFLTIRCSLYLSLILILKVILKEKRRMKNEKKRRGDPDFKPRQDQ